MVVEASEAADTVSHRLTDTRRAEFPPAPFFSPAPDAVAEAGAAAATAAAVESRRSGMRCRWRPRNSPGSFRVCGPQKRAAERWNEKNPPEAHRDIIRVWGVFVDYKSKRQRRWSRALVRHGAVPRTAIAAVLGVAAGNIQVRKTAGPGPFANASRSTPPRTPAPVRCPRCSPVTTSEALLLGTTRKASVPGESHSPYTSPRPRGEVPRRDTTG
jgi:hypothetical protein